MLRQPLSCMPLPLPNYAGNNILPDVIVVINERLSCQGWKECVVLVQPVSRKEEPGCFERDLDFVKRDLEMIPSILIRTG
jgi:hypothetical protein